MEDIARILELFSVADLAVLAATVIGVGGISKAIQENPELAVKVRYPRLFSMGLTFVVCFLGLMILFYMGEHTFAEVLFLTFVFSLAGEQIFYRGREVKKGLNGG